MGIGWRSCFALPSSLSEVLVWVDGLALNFYFVNQPLNFYLVFAFVTSSACYQIRFYTKYIDQYLKHYMLDDTMQNVWSRITQKYHFRRHFRAKCSRLETSGLPTHRQICQILEGSFSAISIPIFASESSFCSIFHLHNLRAFSLIQTQHFSKTRCTICDFGEHGVKNQMILHHNLVC